MANDTPTTGTAVATREPRQIARVENIQPLFDTDQFEQMQRAAKALMHSSLLPESVRGAGPEQCFSNLMLVFDIAGRWNIPAASLAQSIAIVHGKVVYEGKLINAMLKGQGVDLKFHYTGDRGTPGFRIYVWDQDFNTLSEEDLAALAPNRYPRGARMIDGAVSDWQTFDKSGTKPNPAWTGASQRNQLAYRGAREWTRLYEPGHLLGVYGEDEIDVYTEYRLERPGAVEPQAPAPIITATFTDVAEETPEPEKPAARRRAKPAQPEGKVVEGGDVVEITEPTPDPETAEHPAADDTDAVEITETKPEPDPNAEVTPRSVETAKEAGASAARLKQPREPKAFYKPMEAEAWLEGFDGEKASGAETARILEALGQVEQSGFDAGLAGQDRDPPEELRQEIIDTGRTPAEGATYWDNGWLKGNLKREADEREKAEAQNPAAPPAGEDDASLDDDGDDAMGGVFDAFQNGVDKLDNWQEIKGGLNALSRTDAWKLHPDKTVRIRQARISAWMRVEALRTKGAETIKPTDDLTAYRCWIEATDLDASILMVWQELIRSPLYGSLEPQQKHALEKATMARMEAVRQ
jgi:hypothetical protein